MSKYLLLLVSIVSTQRTLASDYQSVELESLDNQTNIYRNSRLSDSDYTKFDADIHKNTYKCLRLFDKDNNKSARKILQCFYLGYKFTSDCTGEYCVDRNDKKIFISLGCLGKLYLGEYSYIYRFHDLNSQYAALMELIYDSGAQNNFSEVELNEKKAKIYQKLSKFWQQVDTAMKSNVSELELELDILKNAYQKN